MLLRGREALSKPILRDPLGGCALWPRHQCKLLETLGKALPAEMSPGTSCVV